MNITYKYSDVKDRTPYLSGSHSANRKERFKKPMLLAGNIELFRKTIHACGYKQPYDTVSVLKNEPNDKSHNIEKEDKSYG